LKEKRYKPIEVQTAKQKRQKAAKNKSFFSSTPRIKAKELSLLTRQLSILILSNVPLDEALGATAKQAKKANVQSVVLEVRSRVLEGYSLTRAMESLPHVFDTLYVAMVNAGERSGYLGPVLERLADYTEKREELKGSVKQALAYPMFLLFFAIVIVVGLVVFLIPKLVKTFASAKLQLPGLTKALISLSGFLASYGWIILVVLVLIWFLFKRWLRNPEANKKWNRFLLGLPIAGELLRIADTARFANTLSVLMSSGVPLLDGLRISSKVLSNDVLKEAASEAADTVQEGGSLRKGMETSGEFPMMMTQMVGSGEISGELEQMLQRSATQQERELDGVIKGALSVLAPPIVVIMGGLVMVIVMAILLPIFQMSNIGG
ncbi:MAG: type II secretion system F family protein, partial [Pseudomonadota bacterium]